MAAERDDHRALIGSLPTPPAGAERPELFGASWCVYLVEDDPTRMCSCGNQAAVEVCLGYGGHACCIDCWRATGRQEVIAWNATVTVPAVAGALGPTPFASTLVARSGGV